jgi:tRNA nucleotidyltransferase (CCA-adding enzyme)
VNLNLSELPLEVHAVAKRVREAGGKPYLVGGAVIDLLQGREAKDWDLEVFGLDYGQLEVLFSDLNPKLVGAAFGIIKLNVNDVDIDVNVPRTDNKVGKGHKGFAVDMDPNMTVREAARRRDFTINTMAVDLVDGHVEDPFGGVADLNEGILRATDPALFVQDPLRALRAMQLSARKAPTVDSMTMRLIQGMSDSFPELAKERVYEEWRKLLLKAEKPSIGLEFLRNSGWLPHFPELEALIDCPQNPEHHPEGDVWVHSLLAADAMAEMRHLIPDSQREAFAFAVFLHDIGKPLMTITPKMVAEEDPMVAKRLERMGNDMERTLFSASGHDKAGEDPAESFLRRMTDNKKVIKLVRGVVGLHMQPFHLQRGEAKEGAYARLARKATEAGGDLSLIGRMCQCDACATGKNWTERSVATGEPNWEHVTSERIFDWVDKFALEPDVLDVKVQGRDLKDLGMKPGREFGPILKKALELQESDADLSKEEILSQVVPQEVWNARG